MEEIICIKVHQLANKMSSWKWSASDTYADYVKLIRECESEEHYASKVSDQNKFQDT